ncbi:porin [Prochlorococcus marinus]|uniref:Possible porin n=1 Tax=Prochlorococcus marinus (strain AS9601) TaxID=146891 RepID=A2BRV0_PROMS|nr:porin [Prochlorococcus marinus]ABM70511.1 possible porin [Prochlorococcus marinus str. AS9601]
MKLFKSLLVAPASLGLLAPMAATANEVTINDFNAAEEIAVTNSRVDGLEARLNNFEAGSFSETTSASFSVDAVLGAIDGATSETTSLDYQFNIGLSTSFTGEDSLDITIDSGNSAASVLSKAMGFDEGTKLNVDGVTYTFPVGGATMIVGDATDISASFTGACLYSAFTDYTPDDCGTGNSLGVTGKAVTASISYAFDNGFSVAGGISSPEDEILGDSSDIYGLNAAYTTDTYGLAVGYSTDDGGTGAETTTWGFQGYYSFDLADLSVGYETQDDGSDDKTGYFVGLTFSDVGPGTVNVAAATTGLFKDTESEKMIYEASYSYPVNDGMTITPGVFIVEDTTDDTGVAVKASFSF